jgi:hypothetical protein
MNRIPDSGQHPQNDALSARFGDALLALRLVPERVMRRSDLVSELACSGRSC